MNAPSVIYRIASIIFSAPMLLSWAHAALVSNPRFTPEPGDSNRPQGYLLTGDAVYGQLGEPHLEYSGKGIRFLSSATEGSSKQRSGMVSTEVSNVATTSHRWFKLQIRALAQSNFSVEMEDLFLQVEFFGAKRSDPLDRIKRRLFSQVRQERKDLRDPGTNRSLGTGTWRTYEMEFRTPFPQINTLRLSAGFSHGNGTGENAEFWIREFNLQAIAPPGHFRAKEAIVSQRALQSLVPLGGRWYYDPSHLSRRVPKRFDHTNVNRLLYLSDRLEAPFVDNTSAWLRDGYYDASGTLVKQARHVPDNVTVTFTKDHLILQSHNLPNHPTAYFPDFWRSLDGNPNHIQEMASTWHLPLSPKSNPGRVAMTPGNANNALPGGPIGVAVNGVVFFNPYDMERNEDAVWRLDRCCGHPAPNSQYHYHKYPVCVKSPWADNGERHSPLIGFAFDGFPIYGPYEDTNIMAKNSATNPLNEFNVHFDDSRGWHYHVTPGSFPHIIGGYWGTLDTKNRRTRGPRSGQQGPRGRRRR